MTERVDREVWFMDGARWVSERATCNRRKVGAILVRDGRVIAQGYNGSPPGEVHCTEEGCLLQDGHCVRTVHAEANVIATCARFGIEAAGATMYVTVKPCNNCARLIRSAGVEEVKWAGDYTPRAELADNR